MPFNSSEIRWFNEDPSLLVKLYEMVSWIDGEDDSEGTRTDHYLETGLNTTGIKLREGRLEIKERIGTFRELEVNEKPIGHLENWVKWSFDGSEGIVLPDVKGIDQENSTKSWIAVEKKRKRKLFGTKGYSLLAVKPGIHLDNGCCVDYTTISIDGGPAIYSLGYEAFGDRSVCERNLIYTIEQTLRTDVDLPDPQTASVFRTSCYAIKTDEQTSDPLHLVDHLANRQSLNDNGEDHHAVSDQ